MNYQTGQKILLIINPNAGKMQSRTGMYDIISFFNSKGYITTVHCTTGPEDAVQTVKFQTEGHDMVVCCGGDGTLNEVISGMITLPSQIPIGYIPAGSANDLARTLDLPFKIKKSVKAICDGTPSHLDIGCMNDEKYFSYIASFGAFTKVSYNTSQKLKNRLGRFAYILGGLKHLGEIHPYKIKITSKEFSTEGDFIFGSVTNTTSIGGILNFNKNDVDLNDGRFEVLLIRKPQSPLELKDILKGLIRHKYDARHIFFFRTDHLEFDFEAPASWTRDGEYGGRHTHVAIDNINSAVQIIR